MQYSFKNKVSEYPCYMRVVCTAEQYDCDNDEIKISFFYNDTTKENLLEKCFPSIRYKEHTLFYSNVLTNKLLSIMLYPDVGFVIVDKKHNRISDIIINMSDCVPIKNKYENRGY